MATLEYERRCHVQAVSEKGAAVRGSRPVFLNHCATAHLVYREIMSGVPWKMIQTHLIGLKKKLTFDCGVTVL